MILDAIKPASLTCALGLQVVGVSVYALGFILVGSAVAICNLCGVEIGQGTTGILVDIGVVSSAMSMLVLPLLLAAVIATSWMLCMYRWVRPHIQHDSQAFFSGAPVSWQWYASICISLSSQYRPASTK